MRWIRLVNISQKSEFSDDAWKSWDSVLGHKNCLVANSRSTGPQQRNIDDHNWPFDTAERSTSADWRTTDDDDWRRRLFVCNCMSVVRNKDSSIKHWTSLALHCYNNAAEKFYKTITMISPIPTTQSCPNEQLTLHNTVQLYTGYITHDCPLSLCRSSLLTSEPVCRDTSPSHQHFAVA